MLLPPTYLSFGLPVSPACLSVSETSMDYSGHKGNTGQLLNSRVLGVLYCRAGGRGKGGGGVESPTKFKKKKARQDLNF